MRNIIITIVFLLLESEILAQYTNHKLLETPLLFHPYKDYWRFMRNQHTFFSGGISFNITKFPTLSLWGLKPQIKIAYFPFFFEFGNINDIWTFNKINIPIMSYKNSIQRGGGTCYDLKLSVCPWPYWGRLSEIIVPDIALGYQFSKIELLEGRNKSSSFSSRLDLSGWLYGFGVNLFIDNMPFNVVLNYERSLKNPNKSRGYQSLNIGIFMDVKRRMKQKDKLYLLY